MSPSMRPLSATIVRQSTRVRRDATRVVAEEVSSSCLWALVEVVVVAALVVEVSEEALAAAASVVVAEVQAGNEMFIRI